MRLGVRYNSWFSCTQRVQSGELSECLYIMFHVITDFKYILLLCIVGFCHSLCTV